MWSLGSISRVSATNRKVRDAVVLNDLPVFTSLSGGGSVGAFGEPTDFIDPLSSGTNCTRDIPHLKDLGVNTVRVYSVNSTLNHDDCMKGLRYIMLSGQTRGLSYDDPLQCRRNLHHVGLLRYIQYK
jgi:hypothetical protein